MFVYNSVCMYVCASVSLFFCFLNWLPYGEIKFIYTKYKVTAALQYHFGVNTLPRADPAHRVGRGQASYFQSTESGVEFLGMEQPLPSPSARGSVLPAAKRFF